jgi:transcriptional regulator with XRE-family HTH domain
MDKGISYPTVMKRGGAQKDEELIASSTAKVLGENLARLMAAHPDLNSNPKLAAKTRLGTGTISRLRNGAVDANMDTLERMARAFQVEPWQLLVPGIDPGNLPTLQPISEQERRLYARIAEAVKGIRQEE